MFKASIFEHLAIQRYFLEMRALALNDSMKRFAISKLEGPLWNQGRMEQIVALTCVGVETHHMEGQPR